MTEILTHWTGVEAPTRSTIEGRYSRLEPLKADPHAALLWDAYQGAEENWRYLGEQPFNKAVDYHDWVDKVSKSSDPLFFAIIDKETEKPVGVASYLRIDCSNGVIEIGHLNFSPRLQGTRMSTEALYLLIDHAFNLGYRRVEWKCDSLNQPSRRAAERLGFRFEGIFRQHRVVKGLNRDTAWFSIVDKEWAPDKKALCKWLEPDNFTEEKRQKQSLADFRINV